MATIVATLNAASPGTQADNVTTDANLTYKVYNDTDSYVAAESFGSHVSDADVTVSAGVVTITNVVEPSGVGNYKIRSIDEAGNEAILSDAFASFLLQDDFTGSTIDTSKWLVTNPDPADIEISQNGTLKLGGLNNLADVTAFSNKVDSVSTFDASGILVLKFDIPVNNATGDGTQFFAIGLSVNGEFDEGFFITRASLGGANAAMRIREGSADTLSETSSGQLLQNSFKIIKAANGDVSYYYWNGSWVQVGVTTSTGITSGNLKAVVTHVNSTTTAPVDELCDREIDNLYVTDADFATLNPA